MRPQPHPVMLVGAGPGDPDLLTLKAARAIAAADVILVDDLVDRAVLAHARADVRIVEVGKRGGAASTPQGFINRLLIREAQAGHRVVRLKGGDPFLFGRGGEERDALLAAGLQVQLVPGITSGLAAPMAAGISLTHRDASPGVIFVTGHEKIEAQARAAGGATVCAFTDPPATTIQATPQAITLATSAAANAAASEAFNPATSGRIHWEALVASGLTLVIYMGISRAAQIQQALLDAGMLATTPVAAVVRATRADQSICATVLGRMANDLIRNHVASPAILIIGTVAASAVSSLAASALSASDLPAARA